METLNSRINVFDRRVLRRSLDSVRVKGGWRMRYNRELYPFYNEPDTVIYINVLKLQLEGPVKCIKDRRTPLNGWLESKRPLGNPQTDESTQWTTQVNEIGQRGRSTEKTAKEDFWKRRRTWRLRNGLSELAEKEFIRNMKV